MKEPAAMRSTLLFQDNAMGLYTKLSADNHSYGCPQHRSQASADIHKCLDYAVRLGLIANNPSAQTEPPTKQKHTITPEQIKGLLKLFRGDSLEVPVYLYRDMDKPGQMMDRMLF